MSGDVVYSGMHFSPAFEDGMFRYRMSAPVIKPIFDLTFATTSVFSSHLDRFDISGEYEMFCSIVEDMRVNAGFFEPTAHWHNDNAGRLKSGRENLEAAIVYGLDKLEFDERYGSLKKMLDSYIGGHGMTSATAADISDYARFLYAIDHLGLTKFDLGQFCRLNRALVTDLGSVLDANAILGYINPSDKSVVRILEIGAGYGRLAEVLHNVLAGRCRYTIADSVPASLMFSYCYLRRQLPDAKVGSYYSGDTFSEDFDIFIMPAWELPKIEHRWDATVVIEAFQEMNKSHVDFFTEYMESSLNVGGLAYVSGSWQYANREPYAFSNRMQTLWLGNTPRSWTYIHPTHILRKTDQNCNYINRVMLQNFSLNCS